MTHRAAKSSEGYRESGRESPHVTLESLRDVIRSQRNHRTLCPRRGKEMLPGMGPLELSFHNIGVFEELFLNEHKERTIYFESDPVVFN